MKMQIKKSGSFTTIKVKSWPRSHSLSLLFPPASKDGAKNKLDLFQNFPSLLSIVKEQKHFQKEETFFDNLFTRKKMQVRIELFFALLFRSLSKTEK